MDKRRLYPGDKVRLLSMPDGHSSEGIPLTVGNIYTFQYHDGSNVCTTTDEEGFNAHYSRERVEKVEGK